MKSTRIGRMQIVAYFYVGSSFKSEMLHSANMMIIEKIEQCTRYRIQGITFDSKSTNISSVAREGVEVSVSHIMFDSIHPVDDSRPLFFFTDCTHNVESLHRMCQNCLIELTRSFCVLNHLKSKYLGLRVVDTVLQCAKDNLGDFRPHLREDHVRFTNTYEKMKQAHPHNLFSSQKAGGIDRIIKEQPQRFENVDSAMTFSFFRKYIENWWFIVSNRDIEEDKIELNNDNYKLLGEVSNLFEKMLFLDKVSYGTNPEVNDRAQQIITVTCEAPL